MVITAITVIEPYSLPNLYYLVTVLVLAVGSGWSLFIPAHSPVNLGSVSLLATRANPEGVAVLCVFGVLFFLIQRNMQSVYFVV